MSALLSVVAAAAAMASFNVPDTLGPELRTARRATNVPILLPQSVRSDAAELYGFKDRVSGGRYGLGLASDPGCRWDCFVASFGGIRGSGVIGGIPVALAKGREGRLHHHRIEWHERGTIYVLALADASPRRTRIRLANSAIRNGPR